MLATPIFTGVFTTDAGQLFLRFVRRFTCASIEPAWHKFSKRPDLYSKCLDHAKRWNLTIIRSDISLVQGHGKEAYEQTFRTFCENIGLPQSSPPDLPYVLQRFVYLVCDEPSLRNGTFFDPSSNDLTQYITCMECIREAFSHFVSNTPMATCGDAGITTPNPAHHASHDVCSMVDSIIHPDDSISNIGCARPTCSMETPSAGVNLAPTGLTPPLEVSLQSSGCPTQEQDSCSEHTHVRSDVSLKSEARCHELNGLVRLMRR